MGARTLRQYACLVRGTARSQQPEQRKGGEATGISDLTSNWLVGGGHKVQIVKSLVAYYKNFGFYSE